MSTQHEVPEARVALVTKVHILIYAIRVECKILFTFHQLGTTDDGTIDLSNEVSIVYFLRGGHENYPYEINVQISLKELEPSPSDMGM